MKKKRYHNSKTGQAMDRRTGRFKSKPGGGKSAPVELATSASLNEHLRALADPKALAQRIKRSAIKDGDWAAINLMVRACEAPVASGGDELKDFEKLTFKEMVVFADLLRRGRGEDTPSFLGNVRALLAEITPPEIEEEGEEEQIETTEEPEPEIEIAQAQPAVEPPKPVAQVPPRPVTIPRSSSSWPAWSSGHGDDDDYLN